jgi:hypothetical protein
MAQKRATRVVSDIRASAQVDTMLSEGQSILKVHRIGAGKDTQYMFTPA